MPTKNLRPGFIHIIVIVVCIVLFAVAGLYFYGNSLSRSSSNQTAESTSSPTSKTATISGNLSSELLSKFPESLEGIGPLPGSVHFYWIRDDGEPISLTGEGFSVGSKNQNKPTNENNPPDKDKQSLISNQIKTYFESEGFAANSTNLKYLEDKIQAQHNNYNYFGRFAYSKEGLYCKGEIDIYGVSVICGTEDSATDKEREPFKDAVYKLEGQKLYFELFKEEGNFAKVDLEEGFFNNPSFYLQKENGSWVGLFKVLGNSQTKCSSLSPNSVPKDLLDDCSD